MKCTKKESVNYFKTVRDTEILDPLLERDGTEHLFKTLKCWFYELFYIPILFFKMWFGSGTGIVGILPD